jgi:hypothetical protein
MRSFAERPFHFLLPPHCPSEIDNFYNPLILGLVSHNLLKILG